jgi:hypothetical protein
MASVGGSLGWLRSFDVYRKVERDFTKQTRTGAALSLLALLFTLGLFATELASFLTVTVETDMDVDATSHVATFDALFSITLPNMPCAAVSLDVEDTMGRHEVGVESMLRKRRWVPGVFFYFAFLRGDAFMFHEEHRAQKKKNKKKNNTKNKKAERSQPSPGRLR